MRSKNILSIAAFIAAFAFSTAFAGLFIEKSEFQLTTERSYFRYDRQTASDISSLLYRDIRNGRERDRKLYRLGVSETPFSEAFISKYAETVEVYSASSDAISDSHLPQDFQIAWQKHMHAWRDYADFLNQMEEYPEELQLDRVQTLRNQHSHEIDSTWYEVLRIGRTYGVYVPY